MNLETLTQKKPAILGLTQFVCGFIYIMLVATFFQVMKRTDIQPPEFFAALIMLTLLVISATIMGIIFLGIPIYLVLKNNFPKALKIIGFTLLFSLTAIVLLITLVFIVRI